MNSRGNFGLGLSLYQPPLTPPLFKEGGVICGFITIYSPPYREGLGEGLLLTNSSIIVKVMSSLSGNVSRTLLILNRPILIIRF